MIPRTFPSSVAFNGSAQMIVYFLPSVAGLTRWVDYIPVKFTTADSDAKENTYDQDGYIPVLSIPSIAGLTPFKEYVPVFLDSFAADADVWDVNITGFIPVGTAGVGGAALYLDFAASQFLDPRITFTRASTATYFNSAGVLTTTGFNLLTYSEQFDNAAWTKTRTTITANAIVSPDGTMDADKMVDDTGTGSHTVRNATSVTITSGTTLTASVFAKAAEGTYVIVGIGDGGGVNISRATFNLSTEAITNLTTPAANVSAPTAVITSVGNGWYRCAITATVTGVTTAQQWVFKGSNASGAASYTGDGVSGLYIWGAQLEAGSVATAYVPTGATNTSSAPRFDYDPATLAPRGLLLEEQRTNLLTYSEQFDDAAWTKSRVTITADAIVSPDGTMDADKLVDDTGTGNHSVRNATSVTITSGTTLTASVFAKAAEGAFIVLGIGDGGASNISRARFNLLTGAITDPVTPVANVSAPITAMTPVGNGWYRCTLTATVTGVTTAQQWIGKGSNATGAFTYTGDGTSGIYIYGAQLEAGAFATSYIPTVASQVTRAADVAVMTGTNFSSWFNATEGTFYLDADMYATQHGFFRHFLSANTGSGVTSDFIGISNPANSNNAAARVTTANVAQCSMQAFIASDAEFRAAFAYKTNNSAVSYDGATSLADNSVTLPTGIDQLYIGGVSSSGVNAATHIRKIAYYPRRLSNAQLQGITA